MLTVKQLERLWQLKQYQQMTRLCLELRPESSPRLLVELAQAIPAASLALIRLDELNQAHTPLSQLLIRTLLAAQEADGGWIDPMTTALCLRALRCGNGAGDAIDRGMQYLASLQKTSGAWPKVPIRRMAADPFVTAFILFQLAEDPRFAQAVRMDDAFASLELDQDDVETRRLHRAGLVKRQLSTLRCPAPAWS